MYQNRYILFYRMFCFHLFKAISKEKLWCRGCSLSDAKDNGRVSGSREVGGRYFAFSSTHKEVCWLLKAQCFVTSCFIVIKVLEENLCCCCYQRKAYRRRTLCNKSCVSESFVYVKWWRCRLVRSVSELITAFHRQSNQPPSLQPLNSLDRHRFLVLWWLHDLIQDGTSLPNQIPRLF